MEANLFSNDLRSLLSTTANMDIYVATTGDDVLGDGSMGSPYATITRAMEDVPKEICHIVHVHVAAGAYTSFPEFLSYELVGDGAALSIDASAAIATFDAGPYTIDVGGVVAQGSTYVAKITVAGGGIGVDAWKGKFLRMLTGAAAGHLIAVATNTATEVVVLKGFSAPAAGDTFDIVDPGVSILVAHDVAFNLSSPKRGNAGQGVLTGVRLECEYLYGLAGSWSFPGTVLAYKYAVMNAFWHGEGYLYSSIPLASLIDDTAYVSGWGGSVILALGVGAGASDTTTLQDGSEMYTVLALRNIDLARGNPSFVYSAIWHDMATYGVDAYMQLGSFFINSLYLRVPNTHDGIRIKLNGFAHLDDIFVERARYAVTLSVGANVNIVEIKGTDANVTNALYMGQGSRAVTKASACTLVGASGAGNAVKWASGVANSAYPTANNVVTDTRGAQVAGC